MTRVTHVFRYLLAGLILAFWITMSALMWVLVTLLCYAVWFFHLPSMAIEAHRRRHPTPHQH